MVDFLIDLIIALIPGIILIYLYSATEDDRSTDISMDALSTKNLGWEDIKPKTLTIRRKK